MLHTVRIDLGPRSYPVYIGEHLLGKLGRLAREASLTGNAALVTDSTVAALYREPVAAALEDAGFRVSTHVIDSGERSKSFAAAEQLCEEFAHKGVDRRSFVVALGGGVVGDLAGFVAAIYYRGIPVIQVPTTVMAQVDSSVGGKTGINLGAGKNLVGAFHQPVAVIADTRTLESLGRREWNEGFAEIIKYGVIRDKELFAQLESCSLPDLIHRCVAIKGAIVALDERETSGDRALLNFGHTLGHAIETAAGYGTLLHGEAVALGMLAAAQISVKRAGLSEAEAQQIRTAIMQFDLPIRLPASVSRAKILQTMFADKKFVSGRIRFVVSPKLGSAVVSEKVTEEDLESALEALEAASP